MLAALRQLATPPLLATEEATARARALFRVAWGTFAMALAFLGALIALEPETWLRRGGSIVVVTGVVLGALALNRRGRARPAGALLVFGLIALISQRAMITGGISAPSTFLFVVLVLIAGLLLDTRGGAIVGAILVLISLGLALTTVRAAVDEHFGPISIWLYSTLVIGLALLVQREVARTVRAAVGVAGASARAQRRAERRLRLAIEAGQLGVWDYDPRTDQLTVDPELFALYDIPPTDDGRLSRELWLTRVHPDDRARVEGALRELLTGAASIRVEFRALRRDGSIRYVESAGVAELDERGGIAQVVGVNRDVTDATHTRELRAAKEAAERASRAKSTFLSTVSHEIRTPMNTILGYAQLLRRDRALLPAQHEKVDVILSSSDHLLTLMNNVLEMSRIEAGRTALVATPFDLHALIDGLTSMFGGLVAAKGLWLSVEGTSSLPRVVQADAGRIRQVLINLLSNAVKFTDRGGVAVRASAAAIAAPAHRVTIDVVDTGPGIEPHDLARLFAAFEQSAAGVRAGGAGLGLAISRDLARLMGGDLTATSEVGAGSTFSFSFSVTTCVEAPRLPARSVVGLAPGQPEMRVLVVDDRIENARMVEELLTAIGFAARVALDGAEAIAIHDAWRPALVLMDIHMPGESGLDVARRLRAGGSTAVIVAFTASGLDDAEAEARAAGLDDYFLKPYRDADLLERFGGWIGARYVYDEGAAPADLAAVPSALRERLRLAAVQARAAQIDQLAVEIEAIAPAAAAGVRALAAEFRYDDLVGAVDSIAPPA